MIDLEQTTQRITSYTILVQMLRYLQNQQDKTQRAGGLKTGRLLSEVSNNGNSPC